MEMKVCTKCGKELPATREYFHPAKRYRLGLTAWCKTCIAAYRSEYRRKNIERCLAQERAEVERNREKRYASARERRAADPDRHRGYQKKHRALHHERCLEQERTADRKRYSLDRDRILAKNTRWRERHPEIIAARDARRRAVERNAPGTLTAADVAAQFARQRGRCHWCGVKVTDYHVDHVWPLSRGGANDASNIVIACPPCNLRKKDKLPHEAGLSLC